MSELTYLEKLDAIIASPEKYDLPNSAVVLCQYLKNFRPTQTSEFDKRWEKSTADIQNDLIDMVKLEMNEIVTIMLLLGFYCKQFYVVNYMWDMWFNEPINLSDEI